MKPSPHVGPCAALALLLALMTPQSALSDGGMMPPYGYDLWEPSQKALIIYDDESRTEEMILQVDFEGESEDFAWLVPVPAVPVLKTADYNLFWDLAKLTQPLEKRSGSFICSGDDGDVVAPGGLGRDNEVDIYNRETVGIFETMTIGAESSGALADSLEQWGYLHEANRQAVESVLQFYIDKSWYFVAMKIDSASAAAERHGHYWYGPIDPIHLSFESTEIVYPMKISSISAREDDPSMVLLYVCTDHRMTFEGASTEYANHFSIPEFTFLRENYAYLGPYLTAPPYLTKLRVSLTASEMTDDIVLERASTDDEYREVYGAGIPATELMFLVMGGAILWRARRTRRRNASPA